MYKSVRRSIGQIGRSVGPLGDHLFGRSTVWLYVVGAENLTPMNNPKLGQYSNQNQMNADQQQTYLQQHKNYPKNKNKKYHTYSNQSNTHSKIR